MFEILVEDLGRAPAGAHLLPNAQPAQSKHARLHAGQNKGHGQAGEKYQPDENVIVHLTASTSNSRTRRSSATCAVSFRPRKNTDSPWFGTTSNRLINRPPMVSTSRTSPSNGYSRRKSSSRNEPLTRQRPGAIFSMTKPFDSTSS